MSTVIKLASKPLSDQQKACKNVIVNKVCKHFVSCNCCNVIMCLMTFMHTLINYIEQISTK